MLTRAGMSFQLREQRVEWFLPSSRRSVILGLCTNRYVEKATYRMLLLIVARHMGCLSDRGNDLVAHRQLGDA
jgi:hypothetical protein